MVGKIYKLRKTSFHSVCYVSHFYSFGHVQFFFIRPCRVIGAPISFVFATGMAQGYKDDIWNLRLCPGVWLLLLLSQLLQLPIHAEWCPLLNANTTAANLNNNKSDSNSSVHCGLDFTLSYTVIIILTLILHLGEIKLTFIFFIVKVCTYNVTKERIFTMSNNSKIWAFSKLWTKRSNFFTGFELDYHTVILRTIKNLFRKKCLLARKYLRTHE